MGEKSNNTTKYGIQYMWYDTALGLLNKTLIMSFVNSWMQHSLFQTFSGIPNKFSEHSGLKQCLHNE